MSAPVRLDDASIEAIAAQVAALLAGSDSGRHLVDAAQVARRFGLSRSWVYENASALGAIRVGNGKRPRLRFDLDLVTERLTSRSESRESEPRKPRRKAKSGRTGRTARTRGPTL